MLIGGSRKSYAGEEIEGTDIRKAEENKMVTGDVSTPVGCFANFLEDCSIPGLRYMRIGAHWTHRIFWFMIMTSALSLCATMSQHQYSRWRDAPVIVTRETLPRKVSDLPLPATTFCLEKANIEPEKFNYSEIIQRALISMEMLTEKEKEIVQDLSLLKPEPGLKEPVNISSNVFDHIENFGFTGLACTEISGMGCDEEAGQILSPTGLCITYNSLPGFAIFRENSFHRERNYWNILNLTKVDWSPDTGYLEKLTGNEYPKRVKGHGPFFSQYLVIHTWDFPEDNNIITMQLHSPSELPSPNDVVLGIEGASRKDILLEPLVVRTDPEVRKWYTPLQRQCYFEDEKYLRYFILYTQHNCEYECLSNLTLARCGCVPFYFPRDKNDKICQERENDCTLKSREMMSNDTVREQCDCKASCSQLEYPKTVINSTSWDTLLEEASEMDILFPRMSYVAFTRTELFGTIDFVAHVGGLLGLFLGMSLLSVLELLFWLIKLLVGFFTPLVTKRN